MERTANTGSNMADIFHHFSIELYGVLQSLFSSVGRCRSSATKRARVWSAFHARCLEKLPKLWKQLFTSGSMIDTSDPLLPQSVNKQLFEMLLRDHFTQFETPVSQRASTEPYIYEQGRIKCTAVSMWVRSAYLVKEV